MKTTRTTKPQRKPRSLVMPIKMKQLTGMQLRQLTNLCGWLYNRAFVQRIEETDASYYVGMYTALCGLIDFDEDTMSTIWAWEPLRCGECEDFVHEDAGGNGICRSCNRLQNSTDACPYGRSSKERKRKIPDKRAGDEGEADSLV